MYKLNNVWYFKIYKYLVNSIMAFLLFHCSFTLLPYEVITCLVNTIHKCSIERQKVIFYSRYYSTFWNYRN